MSPELIAIVLVGSLLAVAELATFAFAMRTLREITRIQRAIAGLIVQESEKIETLLRA